MRHSVQVILGAAMISAAAFAPLSCGSKAPPPPAPPPTVAVPTPPPPAAPTPTKTADNSPKNDTPADVPGCPSAVAGAQTKAKDIKNGIALTVTTTDSGSESKIRDLARKQAALKADPTAAPNTAPCPIVHANTDITVEDMKGGALIKVIAKSPKEATALRKTTRQELDAATKQTSKHATAPGSAKAAPAKKKST